MYYLLIKDKKKLDAYKREFLRVKESIQKGITPVFCEMRSAKINLIESFPYNLLNGLFLILGTLLFRKLDINEILSIAVVLIMNSLCGCISNYIFVYVKHRMRISLCNRLGIEPSEQNIAVMESLEYQSV